MIPTIEDIVEGLLAGTITKQQAIEWLHQHAEGAYVTLRDEFAAAALTGILSDQRARDTKTIEACVVTAYDRPESCIDCGRQAKRQIEPRYGPIKEML